MSGNGDLMQKLLALMISIIALLPALTFHEWAHGYMAYKLGDATAKADGRLSLNPLDHLDPFGTLMLLIMGFGWAKPVPVNTRYFKKPKRDFALTALAGPMMNFIVALISAFLFVLTWYIVGYNDLTGITSDAILMIFDYSMVFNIGLGLFNLIPLPPLDGSNILICMLPNSLAAKYSRVRYYSGYIFIGLILLQYVPVLDFIPDLVFAPLNICRNFLTDAFINLADTVIYPIFYNM